MWQCEEDSSTHGTLLHDTYIATYKCIVLNFFSCNSFLELYKYGPRIVVRCIKPIMKGDEVCISYIDFLQTRVPLFLEFC
jgi:SET domain-containing protein